MARWEPDTKGRLRAAALELFDEQGFGETTVDDVVARAGLTKRTFFRHFSDKREVFFGDDEIPALATEALRTAPADTPPMQLVAVALQRLAAERFEPRRDEMTRARRLIETEPALRERDLRKQDDLRAAIRRGLLDRGEDPLTARVVAGLTVELVQTAIESWLADPATGTGTGTLRAHLDAVLLRMASALDVVDRRGS